MLTKLFKLDAMNWKLSMNFRSPILKVMNFSLELGFPSILRLPIWLLISTGFLTDQMSVVAPDIMHDNG